MAKTKKLLLVEVVEDEPVMQHILAETFVKEGFEVSKAKDGQEGLKLALSGHPDLILLDVIMPNMDGMTMLKKLREDEWGKKVPVVMLSNVNSMEKISEALMGQAFDYLVKAHVEPKDIVKKVKDKLHVK